LLGWSPREFAARAGVDLSTVYRVEATARGQARTIEKLTTTLEKYGVQFIEDGVRLVRKPPRRP
jgi:hypothetical protein